MAAAGSSAGSLPHFYNPVATFKFSCLLLAVGLAFVVYRMNRRQHGYWEQSAERLIAARVIAGMSLLLWLGVLLGGRWIAYSEYITDPFHVPFAWEDLAACPPIIRSLSYARPREGPGESRAERA